MAQKSRIWLGLPDKELKKALEIAERENIDLQTAVLWLVQDGIKFNNGADKQGRLKVAKE